LILFFDFVSFYFLKHSFILLLTSMLICSMLFELYTCCLINFSFCKIQFSFLLHSINDSSWFYCCFIIFQNIRDFDCHLSVWNLIFFLSFKMNKKYLKAFFSSDSLIFEEYLILNLKNIYLYLINNILIQKESIVFKCFPEAEKKSVQYLRTQILIFLFLSSL
jgi:hypothetical protein